MFLRSKSIRTKIFFAVCASCAICASIAISVAVYFKKQEFEKGIVEKARTIHSRLASATRFVANQNGLNPIIKEYTAKYTSPEQLNETDKENILRQVPIYAAMKIGADDAEKEHYQFRVFSTEARNEKY